MEILPFVSFVLWATGLSTVGLLALAVIDWRRNQQTKPAQQEAVLEISPRIAQATPAQAEAPLLKAA